MRLFLLLGIIIICSCSNDKLKRKRITIGDQVVESYFINDTIFNGVTTYYDLNGKLESKISFINGEKHGSAINYHANGGILDSSFYKNGFREGAYFIFDSSGSLKYSDFYWRGYQIGGRIFYEKNRPVKYVFNNFEKREIFSAEYDSLGMAAFGGEWVNANLYFITENNIKRLGLFMYLLNPPTVKLKYVLALVNERTEETQELATFDNHRVFIDTILPIPPIGYKYVINVDQYDSANNQRKIIINKLEWMPDPSR